MARLSDQRLVYTQAFGDRDKQSTVDKSLFHWGVDYGPVVRNTTGVPLNALSSGRATRVEDQYGALCIRIGTRATEAFELWHLDRYLVADGAFVEAGTPVGVMGSTGKSTGVHVHVEHWVRGKRIDPKPFIDAQASKPVAPAPDDYDTEDDMAQVPQTEWNQMKADIAALVAAVGAVRREQVEEDGLAQGTNSRAVTMSTKVDALHSALLEVPKGGSYTGLQRLRSGVSTIESVEKLLKPKP